LISLCITFGSTFYCRLIFQLNAVEPIEPTRLILSVSLASQIAELEGLDQKQISTYQTVITGNNINGKVLATCDLNELGHIMGMTFGDWQLFRAWVLAARKPAQECTAWYVTFC